MVRLLSTQQGDAVCGHCCLRFCLHCSRGHHEPIPCKLVVAWERFLDSELPTAGLLRDLSFEGGRKAALKLLKRKEALETLWQLDSLTGRVLAASKSDETAVLDLIATMEELAGLVPKLSLREDMLAAQWRQLLQAKQATEAVLAEASEAVRRFNVELGKAAQEPEHDRAAARVGEAEAGPAQGNAPEGPGEIGLLVAEALHDMDVVAEMRHGPAVLYNMMLGGAGGLQQLQDDDVEYEGMGRGYDPRVIINDHIDDRHRRAGEDQRHERILDLQEIRLLHDLSRRLARAGVPACGETSDAVHQTSVLLRSIQLTMQLLARQASLRTRLARLGRERVVDRAAREREWRELVGRESARIKGTLASLKREVKLFVDMSSADSRVRLALRLSVPDNQGATMQVSPGPSGPRLSDGSMRASVPTCQEAVAVGGGTGAEDGTGAAGGQAGAGAQEERSVATIVDEAVGGFLSDTLPESKTADPPFTGEWRRELHEKLVALVRRAYLGDRIPDQGLRDALRDVDWEAVALMAGGLDRSHLELLLQARLSPEERRELEKRREEEERFLAEERQRRQAARSARLARP